MIEYREEEELPELEETEESEEIEQAEVAALTRESFFDCVAAAAPRVKPVKVPEWKGRVYVRELTMGLFSAMQMAISERSDSSATYSICVIFCMCDESGEPLLTMSDFEMLQNQSARAIMKVFAAAAEMNPLMGFNNEEEKKA